MHKLVKSGNAFGRCCIGIAMIGFGLQHLVYRDFVTRLVPKLPAWIPAHSLLACAFGAALTAAGVALLFGKGVRVTALLLGTMILASFALLYLPLLAGDPGNAGLWVNAGKALALSGGALLIAGGLTSKPEGSDSRFAAVADSLERLVPLATWFVGAFFAYCGVLHFVYVSFVASLVPPWIPGHVFWTYFSGVMLVAGGLGMNVRPTARLAAGLSALMLFLWVILLHIPRALANLRDSNETTAVFEALAIAAAALLAASGRPQRALENSRRSRPIHDLAGMLRNGHSKRTDPKEAWGQTAHEEI